MLVFSLPNDGVRAALFRLVLSMTFFNLSRVSRGFKRGGFRNVKTSVLWKSSVLILRLLRPFPTGVRDDSRTVHQINKDIPISTARAFRITLNARCKDSGRLVKVWSFNDG